jgi:hypothetical protein
VTVKLGHLIVSSSDCHFLGVRFSFRISDASPDRYLTVLMSQDADKSRWIIYYSCRNDALSLLVGDAEF